MYNVYIVYVFIELLKSMYLRIFYCNEMFLNNILSNSIITSALFWLLLA